MANTTTSPNMNLPVPVVSVDPGPDWSNNINACMSAIDSHDHSPGKGVPVTPAGINITSNLSFNSNAILALLYAQLVNNGSTFSGVPFAGTIYEYNGDLWFTNGIGFPVQITSGNFNNASVYACNQIVEVTGNVTLTNKGLHYVDTSTPISLQLPAPSPTIFITVKDSTGNAETDPMTLVRFGTEKIETVAANYSLNYSLGAWNITSDGVDWFIS